MSLVMVYDPQTGEDVTAWRCDCWGCEHCKQRTLTRHRNGKIRKRQCAADCVPVSEWVMYDRRQFAIFHRDLENGVSVLCRPCHFEQFGFIDRRRIATSVTSPITRDERERPDYTPPSPVGKKSRRQQLRHAMLVRLLHGDDEEETK